MINHWKPCVFSTGIFYLFILNLSEAVWDNLAYHTSRSDTTHWLVDSRYNIYIYKHSKEPSLIICECSLSNLSWTEVVAGSISEKKSLNIVRKKWIQTENSTVNYVVSTDTETGRCWMNRGSLILRSLDLVFRVEQDFSQTDASRWKWTRGQCSVSGALPPRVPPESTRTPPARHPTEEDLPDHLAELPPDQ